jgi:hypothetical protein
MQMKVFYSHSFLWIGALATFVLICGAAQDQVPAGNGTSDNAVGQHTGVGTGALGGPAASNGGLSNTAVGYKALGSNSTGNYDTASGADALSQNTTGCDDTALGSTALYQNTTGSSNTAFGFETLRYNHSGNYNTATGYQALRGNYADYNAAFGYVALYANATGTQNAAYKIGIGQHAGINLTTDNNNIDIDIGRPGAAGESGVIGIGTVTGGTSTQSATYIAGIYGGTPASGGTAVFIESTGLLGTVRSSERFKTSIAPMRSSTGKLSELRPVKFQYKADPDGTVRYGLIAEKVAQVHSELVVRDACGRIDGARHDELAPMLLKEMQAQKNRIAAQDHEFRTLKRQAQTLDVMKKQLSDMRAALVRLQSNNALVAQR